MKRKNLSGCLGGSLTLYLLLLAPLATHACESLSQIGFYTFRVSKRRIKDGFHNVSTSGYEGTKLFDELPQVKMQLAFHRPLNRVTSDTYELASSPELRKRKVYRHVHQGCAITAVANTVLQRGNPANSL